MFRKNSMSWWLKRAITKDDLKEVKQLTSKHPEAAYLNARDDWGNTALLLAANRGHVEIVQYLLSLPAVDTNAESNNKQTAVNLLLKSYGRNDKNSADTYHQLLKQILDDERTMLLDHPSLQYALKWCIRHRYNDTACELIEKYNVDINCGALAVAADEGNLEMLFRLLAEPNIQVMQQDNYRNDALTKALSYRHDDSETSRKMLLALLDHPRVNVSQKYKRSISYDLHNVALVELASRSDPNDLDKTSCNTLAVLAHPNTSHEWVKKMNHPVLTWAKRNLSPELFRDLPGIHIEQTDIWGYSYSGWKVTVEKTKLLNFLANDPRFDINLQLWDGSTSLTCAIRDKDKTRTDVILQRKECDVLTQEHSEKTALLVAEQTGNTALVDGLIKGISFNQTYSQGRNIVMLAAASGLTNLVQRLLTIAPNQFDINAQEKNGDTALTLAVSKHNNPRLVEALMKAGANPFIKNKSGWDALMVASDKQFLGLYELMSRSQPAPISATAPNISTMGIYSAAQRDPIQTNSAQSYYEPPKYN